MKLLVFAHTPPPHHGQSYMVKLLLDGFGGDQRRRNATPPTAHGIECYHVDARLSTDLEDIGEVRFAKVYLLFWYCLQAIWCRFRYGVTTFYYIPAPGKLTALIRDWFVLAVCRVFFKRTILHWHAAGMAKWLETSTNGICRDLSYRAFGRPDLCIVLSQFNYSDAEKFWPRRIRVVGNGLPDPCPDFETTVLPRRLARLAARKELTSHATLAGEETAAVGADPHVFRILYLAHCTREKGLFDTLDGVALAAARLQAEGSPVQLHLTVAGQFMRAEEETEFKARLRQPDLLMPDGRPRVGYAGFLSGRDKTEAFLQSDCFCFPTYYYAESFGLVVLEAMSSGLPVVTTRWRSIPELLPVGYEGLVSPQAPAEVADALLRVMMSRSGQSMRRAFLDHYALDKHLEKLARAFHAVEREPENDPAHSRLSTATI
jgi:glycosyltransferase involved in cell wall biosynthesis